MAKRPYPTRVVDGVQEPVTPPLPPADQQRFRTNGRLETPPLPSSHLAHTPSHEIMEPLALDNAPESSAPIPNTSTAPPPTTAAKLRPPPPPARLHHLQSQVDLVQKDYGHLIHAWADAKNQAQDLQTYCNLLQSDAFWHALDLKVHQDMKHIVLKANKMLIQRTRDLHEALNNSSNVLKQWVQDHRGYEQEMDNCHRQLVSFWDRNKTLQHQLDRSKVEKEELEHELERVRQALHAESRRSLVPTSNPPPPPEPTEPAQLPPPPPVTEDMSGPFQVAPQVLGKRPRTETSTVVTKTIRIPRDIPLVFIPSISDTGSYTHVPTKKRKMVPRVPTKKPKMMLLDCVEIVSCSR